MAVGQSRQSGSRAEWQNEIDELSRIDIKCNAYDMEGILGIAFLYLFATTHQFHSANLPTAILPYRHSAPLGSPRSLQLCFNCLKGYDYVLLFIN
jgi:hypothetical protein